MSNNKRKQVWIDPNSHMLAHLADKRPRVQKQSTLATDESQTPAVVHQVEVLPPEPKRSASPPPLPIPQLPSPTFSPAPDLTQLERLVRQMAETLDFNIPEGFLDSVFGRPNHRREVKLVRAKLIRQMESMITEHLREHCNTAETLRQFNQIRYQQFLDALNFLRTVAEERERLALAHERVGNERAIEAAKTKAEIAKHEAEVALYKRQIRDAKREPLPPAPQPAPPPTLDQIRAEKKQRIDAEIGRLRDDEVEEIRRTTQGKPEAEWSSELQDEVKRIQNMYADARHRKDQERRRYL